eukprot:11384316-Prorocentrum_lima.AAC.1
MKTLKANKVVNPVGPPPFDLEVLQVWNPFHGRNSQKKGWLSTKVGAMSLTSILVQIGKSQGIQPHMYNSEFRWNGGYDI